MLLFLLKGDAPPIESISIIQCVYYPPTSMDILNPDQKLLILLPWPNAVYCSSFVALEEEKEEEEGEEEGEMVEETIDVLEQETEEFVD